MKKAEAVNIPFFAYDRATGEPAAGLVGIVATLSKDGSQPVPAAGAITEVGSGWYSLALTASETDAQTLVASFSHASAVFYAVALAFDDYATTGAPMTLTSEYDAAKTASQLTTSDLPTVADIQAGLATTSDLATLEQHGDATWATATQVTLSTSTKESIAKYVLKTNVADTESTAPKDSLTGLILATFHSSLDTTGAWTINRTDDTTTFGTSVVTTSATASPVTGVSDDV